MEFLSYVDLGTELARGRPTAIDLLTKLNLASPELVRYGESGVSVVRVTLYVTSGVVSQICTPVW